MQIKFTKRTTLQTATAKGPGEVVYKEGQVVDLAPEYAAVWLGNGSAVKVDEPAQAAKEPTVPELKAMLTERGIEIPKAAKKDDLKALLAAPAPHKLGAKATVDEVELVYDETDAQWIVVETGEPFEADVPEEAIVAE